MTTEPIYRLELTERELIDVLDALVAWAEPVRPWYVRLFLGRGKIDRRIYDLYQRIGALEPVGATTEGDGVTTEPIYRLELTERELIDVLDALVAWAEPVRPWYVRLFLGRGKIDRRIYRIYDLYLRVARQLQTDRCSGARGRDDGGAAVSVRVVRDVACPWCEDGRIRVYGYNGIQTADEPCPDCHGSGTTTEPVTCAGCKLWRASHITGFCDMLGFDTSPGFGCAAWEPRE